MAPLLPLFSGAVDLKNFLRSRGIPFLNHFAFPNLTTFELIAMPKEFHASQLFDFLEASPTLRTVRIEIAVEIHTDDVPPERVVVLPNDVTQDEPGYEIVARISCPSTRFTSLAHEQDVEYGITPKVFPGLIPHDLSSVHGKYN
jgi:hypothetical protein